MRPPSEPLTATQLRKESSVGTPPRSLSRRSGRQGTKRDGIGSCHASPPGDKAAGESYCVSIYLTHARHESPGQHLGNNNARQHPHRCFSLRVIVSLPLPTITEAVPSRRRPYFRPYHRHICNDPPGKSGSSSGQCRLPRVVLRITSDLPPPVRCAPSSPSPFPIPTYKRAAAIIYAATSRAYIAKPGP